jgi:hypothetical protein
MRTALLAPAIPALTGGVITCVSVGTMEDLFSLGEVA